MARSSLRATLLPILVFGVAHAGKPAPSTLVKRGEYLVRVMGCNDCHTPLKMGPKGPEPDMARMLSGHPEGTAMPSVPSLPQEAPVWMGSNTMTAFSGPWGISYSSNLTSDKETGIGNWTEEQFFQTVKTGRHFGQGRPIVPPMPLAPLQAASPKDLKSIFAYLRTVPPVKNKVPEYQHPAQ